MKFKALLFSVLAVNTFSITSYASEDSPSQVLFKNVNIYDGLSPKLTSNKDVLVEGNLIKAIGNGLAVAKDVKVIDGKGRTLTPGLIDSHTHLSLVAPLDQMNEMDWGEIGARMGIISKTS